MKFKRENIARESLQAYKVPRPSLLFQCFPCEFELVEKWVFMSSFFPELLDYQLYVLSLVCLFHNIGY